MRNMFDLINRFFDRTNHVSYDEKVLDLRRKDDHKSQAFVAVRNASFRR